MAMQNAMRQREIEDALERIYDAARHGNPESVVEILRGCPDLIRSAYADALLEFAIERGQRAVVDALLKAGIPADSINESGGTPLMKAAWLGRLEIARRDDR